MPIVIPMLRVTINPERLQKGPLRGRNGPWASW